MKTIPLTQGQFAIVDDEDYERLSAVKWCYSEGYAVRNAGADGFVRMNVMNKGAQKNNTSGFKGVYWHKGQGRWAAEIKAGGKRFRLGYFDDKLPRVCTLQTQAQGPVCSLRDRPDRSAL